MKRIVTAGLFLIAALQCTAQTGALEEYFFSSGRIKVVITVALIIAIGIFGYLFRLDKKISNLENNEK